MYYSKTFRISLILTLFKTDTLTNIMKTLAHRRKTSSLLLRRRGHTPLPTTRAGLWDDDHNGTEKEKRRFVLRQLTGMSSRCHITTLELRNCAITGPHTECFVTVCSADTVTNVGAQ